MRLAKILITIIGVLNCFAHSRPLLIVPAPLDRVFAAFPMDPGVSVLSVPRELLFERTIPSGEALSVFLPGAIAETVGILGLLSVWNTSGRNRFLTRSLFDRVSNVVISIRLLTDHIMFRLVPVALERGFHAVP